MGRLASMVKWIRIKLAGNSRYIDILRSDGVKIGKGCSVDKTAVFGTEPYLITLQDNVRITRNVQFITHDGSLWVTRNLGLTDKNADYFGKIVIGENNNIGWNAVIMPGVTTGKNCIIGAGAIITKNVPDNSVVVGIPGRVVSTVFVYAKKSCLCA